MDRILPLASPPPPARLFFLPDAAHAWREEVDGTTACLGVQHLSNAYFNPGCKLVQREGRRNAGRRNPSIGRICGCGARPVRSPVGVPPRLSLRRPNATAQLRLRASWDAAATGVTRLKPVPVQRAPRRPVIVPAGRIPGAARGRQ
jgi:hypothetical protein